MTFSRVPCLVDSLPLTSEAHVEVLRTPHALEQVRSVWESWPGHCDSDLDFFLTVIQSSGETVRPHVMVLYREGRADAILAGRLDRGAIDSRVGYLHFRTRADILYFVYGALRGNQSAGNCELLVKEICASLSRGEADVAYLNFVRTDSQFHASAISVPGLLCRDHIRNTQPHFSLTLPRSAGDFYRGLSPKTRENIKYKARKLRNDFSGPVWIRSFREVSDIDALAQDAEQVASKSYQRGLGVGFGDSPAMRDRLRLKAQKGWLRAYILYIANRPIAYWIADLNLRTLGGEFVGYDPDLAQYSPGMCLMTKVIEDMCNDPNHPIEEVDFAQGHAHYKEALSNREWQEAAIYIFARSLKGLRLGFDRLVFGGTDMLAKRLIGHTKLVRRIKKAWRGRITPRKSIEP
jgi:hypothetical protein